MHKSRQVIYYYPCLLSRTLILCSLLFVFCLASGQSPSTIISEEERFSLFTYLHQQEDVELLIEVNSIDWILESEKEEYHPAVVHVRHSGDADLSFLPVRIRARGGIRKTVCHLPPVKIDFKKSTLDSLGFRRHDKLKLVLPCGKGQSYETLLKKEFFLYELYHLVDSNGLQAKLVDVVIWDENKVKYDLTGILLEDESEYSRRKGVRVIENGHVNSETLNRSCFVNMIFFQYMIANTDWSVANKHNLEIVGHPNGSDIYPIPYDFDYSGFVGQTYAMPYDELPIDDVHDRYFFPYEMTRNEFDSAVAFFLSREGDFYERCQNVTYLDEKTKKSNANYLASFFYKLRKPNRLMKKVNIKN